MVSSSSHQEIIEKLYDKYKSQGFIQEDEALTMMAAQELSIQDTERITGILLGMGVIFAESAISDEDDDADRTRTDYEAIFSDALSISPNIALLIDYINKIRPPQYREWHILIPQAQNGNLYARNRLFDMYFRVVVKLALSTHKNEGAELEDMIQEGALGLLRAIKKYDSSKHGSFVSYLPWWIMQYMNRAILDKNRLIRLPVHLNESFKTIENKTAELVLLLDHEPSSAEIADYIGIPEDEVNKMQEYTQIPISLCEYEKTDDDGFVWLDIMDDDSPDIGEAIAQKTLRQFIEKALETLKEREKDIIRQRFGLYDSEPMTLEEIGTQLGLTRERIRQIEEKALKRLRHPSRQRYIKAFY